MADESIEPTTEPTAAIPADASTAVVAETAPVEPVLEVAAVEPEAALPVDSVPAKRTPGRPRKTQTEKAQAEAGPSSIETEIAPVAVEAPVAAESSLTTEPTVDVVTPALPAKRAPRAAAGKKRVPAPKAAPVARKQAAPAPEKAPAARTTRVTIAAAAPKRSAPASRKEHFAMTTANAFTEKFQTSFKDASEKAKAAFGDMGEFTKGNVEAVVASSKILATGLQEMGKSYVAETKTAAETFTTELKGLATAKSPTEFFEKQSALLRKQFDAAVAASSKNSEAVLKLANEAFQPISTRVSLAVEKIKQAA
ncbi:phasin family protein [Novosphingobium percolationis]|uniref:phasin family protein n=1 Tax=Novosphingobium percolationis TaxID=2871811 RepID=UPI001CD699F6|nr:phasin family protein [Novosphingobium percolationis]MCH7629753.1 TIGR01841 family phasin [Pseudomonadota bacterium]